MSESYTEVIESVNSVIVGSQFSECNLIIHSEKLGYVDLLTKIDTFKTQQGWVAYQSKNESFTTKKEAQKALVEIRKEPNIGKILSAELVNVTQSMSVRHLHGDQWQITIFSKDTQGESYLCDRVSQVATSGLGRFNYQRLWGKTTQGYEPFASYFTHFDEGE